MHARVIVAHQETWYHNVTKITADRGYLSLHLAAHPSLVHIWRGGQCPASVMLAATDADVIGMLREEKSL